MKKTVLLLVAVFGLVLNSCGDKKRPGNPKVLVFSKTMGYKHTSIPVGIAAIQKLGAENGFEVDTTKNAELFTEENLEKYATYADAIGPSIEQLILAGMGKSEGNKLVDTAHRLNLKVHAYTFRQDEHPNFETFEALLQFGFYDIDLDGGFTDFPDLVVDYLTN